MTFGILDTLVFVAYIVFTVAFAMWMGSRGKGGQSADGYFKADKQLPWYVVGASIISAGVSSEQFIGTVGIAYLYGMAVANYQWAAPIVYTILIFVFLPYYMRGNVTTMPEYLERRFNSACRRIYAGVSIVSMAFVMLGVIMYAGAKAMNVLFPGLSVTWGILILAGAAGAYSVYGGLLSSVWADFVQYVVLMVGGITVGVYSLHYSGGIENLLDAMPEKAIMLYDARHEVIPWFGLLATVFSVGIWYSCANQLIVQRFLGARSEWDARMGVIMAGFSMAIFPLLVVIPGIAAFYIFHDQLSDGDKAWAYLVQSMLPTGLVGVVLAGLTSSILGTLAAVVNSSSTIFTYDVYKPLIRKNAPDSELFLTGRISATAAMAIGIITALIFAKTGGSVFVQIQTAFSYMAAPIAAVFLVGILWKGATPAAATASLLLGFASLPLVVFWIFPKTFLAPYSSFPHHTFMVFVFSILCVIVISFFTQPKSDAELKGVIWESSALRVPEAERPLNRGLRDFRLWWILMVLTIATLWGLTYSRADHTKWLEAERLNYQVTGGSATLQKRSSVKNFNLWTGSGSQQVLFKPQQPGGSITFDLPVKEAGVYRIAAVVTKAPGYGSFSASVNGTSSTIHYNVTLPGKEPKTFNVEHRSAPVFAADTANAPDLIHSVTGQTVIDRIEMDPSQLKAGTNRVSFTLAGAATAGTGFIGVDQIIITPHKEK
jgi:SSS family solute:Na+ symporter